MKWIKSYKELGEHIYEFHWFDDKEWLDEAGELVQEGIVEPDMSGSFEMDAWEIFEKIEEPILNNLIDAIETGYDVSVEKEIREPRGPLAYSVFEIDLSEIERKTSIVEGEDPEDVLLNIEEMIDSSKSKILEKYEEELKKVFE